MIDIRKAAVIGSGVMGSGIAAQIANAGVPVLLLDKAAPSGEIRSHLAEQAKTGILKTRPAPLMHPDAAHFITTGNLDDDINGLRECDWICEAIVEDLGIKKAVYRIIEQHRRDDAAVTSNTSTIPISRLVDELSPRFRKHFAIAHFFNPPRYMPLLELVAGSDTSPTVTASLERFCDYSLGKTVVRCRDTPGFIANRLGLFWMLASMNSAFEYGITIEETDAAIARFLGVPSTGVFGLADLTGVDLFNTALRTICSLLPQADPMQMQFSEQSPFDRFISAMLAKGLKGRKGNGGFYRVRLDGEQRIHETLDVASGEYRPWIKPASDDDAVAQSGPQSLTHRSDLVACAARDVLVELLHYASFLIPEIADEPQTIDKAMTAGYGWKWGPFELIDQMGLDWLRKEMRSRSLPIPPYLEQAKDGPIYRRVGHDAEALRTGGTYERVKRPADAWTLSDHSQRQNPLASNKSASVWDIGDNVACLELRSKLNSIDFDVLDLMIATTELTGIRALVIGTDGPNFSAGVNLAYVVSLIEAKDWETLESFVRHGQRAMIALRLAPFPIVSAVAGHALGGGCEIALHSTAIQAHAEARMGLVETSVGIIPAWGGCRELLQRWTAGPFDANGPMQAPRRAFELILAGTASTSALHARKLGYLRASDGITMNRSRLLHDAKARALKLADGYIPYRPHFMTLPGQTGRVSLTLNIAHAENALTDHARTIASELARVVTGGDTDISRLCSGIDILQLEYDAFMRLAQTPETLGLMKSALSKRR
jgi:3-hydroxyacyl-CoA dehydrogenase